MVTKNSFTSISFSLSNCFYGRKNFSQKKEALADTKIKKEIFLKKKNESTTSTIKEGSLSPLKGIKVKKRGNIRELTIL